MRGRWELVGGVGGLWAGKGPHRPQLGDGGWSWKGCLWLPARQWVLLGWTEGATVDWEQPGMALFAVLSLSLHPFPRSKGYPAELGPYPVSAQCFILLALQVKGLLLIGVVFLLFLFWLLWLFQGFFFFLVRWAYSMAQNF